MKIREPFATPLCDDRHQSLTAGTVLLARHWYREGAMNMRFAMVRNPGSIEFPDLNSRGICSTYPPGAVMPVYLLSRISHNEPSPRMVYSYNLFSHFLISLLLSLTVFFFISRLTSKYSVSFLLSLIPMLLELLSPMPLYYQQNVFFADQAVLLPFALVIFLETLRMYKTQNYVIDALLWLVMFYGILTDWLFVFIGLILFLKRLLNGELGHDLRRIMANSFYFWSPFIAGLGLFLVQLYSINAVTDLKTRGLLRLGLAGTRPDNFFQSFWLEYVKGGYLLAGVFILWGSLAALCCVLVFILLNRKRAGTDFYFRTAVEAASLAAVALLPCFLQVYTLFEHSYYHEYAALKFSIPMAIVPFVLIPVSLIAIFYYYYGGKKLSGGNMPALKFAPYLLLVLAGFYVFLIHGRFVYYFPGADNSYKTVGEFIDKNTGYKDIVFSFTDEIDGNPVPLSYSMKRVYKIKNISDIATFMNDRKIKGDYVIDIFQSGKRSDNLSPAMTKILSGWPEIKSGDMKLYRISKEDFNLFKQGYYSNENGGGETRRGAL
ncbi:MAG: hypothetical protein M1269_08770 [Chloroflexi bacterium]|nr:hypothetical protein [Chloroflexota bacterium]